MKNLFPQSITHQRKPFLLADTDIVFKRHIWSYQINILNIVLKGESNRNVWLIRTCDSLWFCILFLFVDKIPRKKKKNNASYNFFASGICCLQLHVICSCSVEEKATVTQANTHNLGKQHVLRTAVL